MTKIESLKTIMLSASGYDEAEFPSNMCDLITEYNHCYGVNCENCPFNSAKGMDELAMELEAENEPTSK